MKKYLSLATLALMASTGFAMAQGYGGGYGGGGRGGGAVEIERDDDRGSRGGRDWDRGRDYDRGDYGRGQGRETVIIRTLAPQYRFVEERGRRCRIVITRKQRANGTIVRTERREC